MWVVKIGHHLHSAWDSQPEADRIVGILIRMGKTGVHSMLSREFKGCFNNGYLFN